MKSKNVARLFIFVFFLCFVFLYQGWSQTWDIKESIKIKYPKHEVARDYEDLERDLKHIVLKFKNDIVNEYFTSGEKKKKKSGIIAQMLVDHAAVLVADGESYKSFDDFEKYFKKLDPEVYTVALTFMPGAWIHFEGKARGFEVDIIALTKFKIVFTSGAPISSDYGPLSDIELTGEMTSFHRRICTWF